METSDLTSDDAKTHEEDVRAAFFVGFSLGYGPNADLAKRDELWKQYRGIEPYTPKP